MKTYTHPTITLPAGSVSVVFKDQSKATSSVTLNKCIIDIGDVEEGFDYSFGDYVAPGCTLRFTNAGNDLLADMLDTYTLEVEITVDGELYFIGDIDFESFDPSDIYEDSSHLIGEFEIEFAHRFARLNKYLLTDLNSDIGTTADPNTAECTFGLVFRYLASELGLLATAKTDVEYLVHRKFKYFNDATPETIYLKYLSSVAIEKNYLDTVADDNYYQNRFKDTFTLLGELAREFFFFPSILKDGTDYKLRIFEKDYERTVTLPSVKKTTPTRKFAFNSLTTQLANIPDGMTTTNLMFTDAQSSASLGDDQELNMHHTNISRVYGSEYTNQIIRIDLGDSSTTRIPSSIINTYPSSNYYASIHEAIHEAIKNIYFDNYKWREVTVRGLRATYSSSSKMQYLSPAHRFSLYSSTHYIHTVKKSLVKNESVLTCLVLD